MITFETIKCACPVCGYNVDHATLACAPVKDNAPRAGDVSICFNCASVNMFADGFGTVRRPTEPERRKLASDKRIQRAVRAIQELHAERVINQVNEIQ